MLNLFQSCAKCKSTILKLSQIFADQKLKPKFKWEFWMEKTCRSLNHIFVIVVVVVVIIDINVVVAVVVVVVFKEPKVIKLYLIHNSLETCYIFLQLRKRNMFKRVIAILINDQLNCTCCVKGTFHTFN